MAELPATGSLGKIEAIPQSRGIYMCQDPHYYFSHYTRDNRFLQDFSEAMSLEFICVYYFIW